MDKAQELVALLRNKCREAWPMGSAGNWPPRPTSEIVDTARERFVGLDDGDRRLFLGALLKGICPDCLKDEPERAPQGCQCWNVE